MHQISSLTNNTYDLTLNATKWFYTLEVPMLELLHLSLKYVGPALIFAGVK